MIWSFVKKHPLICWAFLCEIIFIVGIFVAVPYPWNIPVAGFGGMYFTMMIGMTKRY